MINPDSDYEVKKITNDAGVTSYALFYKGECLPGQINLKLQERLDECGRVTVEFYLK